MIGGYLLKFFNQDESLLVDVPERKLKIKIENSISIIGCDNLRIESKDNEIISVTLLTKNIPIGLIDYEKIEYLNLDIREDELGITVIHK